MPTVSDVVSISQAIYAPAIFALIILFVSGSFLDSTRIVTDAVGGIAKAIPGEGKSKSALASLVVAVLLFFTAPLIFNLLGALSPISIAFIHGNEPLSPDHKTRLVQIWCSFPALTDYSMLEAFVRSAASNYAGDTSNILYTERTTASFTYFRHASTSVIILVLSFLMFFFLKKYRRFRLFNLVFSVAGSAALIAQSMTGQRESFGAVDRDIAIAAHSRLLSEGRITVPTAQCAATREAQLRRPYSASSVRVYLTTPRLHSILPVDLTRDRD